MTHHAGLTQRMAECEQYIALHFENHGCSPSFDDIREALGLASKSSVHRLVSALETRGRIRRRPGLARTIEIPEPLQVIREQIEWMRQTMPLNEILDALFPESSKPQVREWAGE